MAIGASKIGLMGGLVPGGTQTFNASGTFIVPPGVRKVNITGRGASGNPGNPGTAGNSGNPGTGGAGGAGGAAQGPQTWTPNVVYCCNPLYNRGGYAYTRSGMTSPTWPPFPVTGPTNYGQAGVSGEVGTSGTAGSAGSAGTSGSSSTGLNRTFLGGTGGTAGNPGTAGAGGSAGTGGGLGGTGGYRNSGPPWSGPGGSGGSGGNFGGSGGQGGHSYNFVRFGGFGGGGAGINSAGNPARSAWPFRLQNTPPVPGCRGYVNFCCSFPNTLCNACQVVPAPCKMLGLAPGGAGAGCNIQTVPWPGGQSQTLNWFVGYGGSANAPFCAGPQIYRMGFGPGQPQGFPQPTNTVGHGVVAPVDAVASSPVFAVAFNSPAPHPNPNYFLRGTAWTLGIQGVPSCDCSGQASILSSAAPNSCNQRPRTQGMPRGGGNTPPATSPNWFVPTNSGAWRAGGGGGWGQALRFGSPYGQNPPATNPMPRVSSGGGGGGGGRGAIANPGGTGGAGGTGSAATPATFNCEPVVPGSSYPIVVGSPGGQVTINWNPQ